jgi:hypothetical protein
MTRKELAETLKMLPKTLRRRIVELGIDTSGNKLLSPSECEKIVHN